MFAISKIAGFLMLPSSLAVVSILVGLALSATARHQRFGRGLAWGGALFLLAAGMLPLGNVLILPLEQRFASEPSPKPGDRIDGIIILGGFEDGWVSAGRGMLTTNEAGERLTEAVRLSRIFPDARIVFSGGVGTLLRPGADATGPVQAYLVDVGVARERIALEGKSRNTYENAQYSAALLRPTPEQRWLLITSAYHMPRATALYRQAGFAVRAYAVDYRTRGPEDRLRPFESIPAGFMRLDLAFKEWLGLIAYRVLGRTDELLPRP